MKLVVISHACITPQNQEFFQLVADASGWEVTIILPQRWTTEYSKGRTVERSPGFHGRLRPVRVFLSGSVPLHFYGLFLFKALYDEKPDVIYVHNESYALSTLQAMLWNRFFGGRPIGFYAAQNIRKRYVWPMRLIEAFNMRQADFCFAVTDSAARTLTEKGFAAHLAVLPLGVTENHFPQVLAVHDAAAEAAGAERVIGYVGRLVPEKGLDVLLRALALLREKNWVCRIVGDGPQKEELRQLGRQLGIDAGLQFTGYVAHGEIARHMKNFSILVLPSLTRPNWTEQFGRVIIEALAAGVPVIGSTCGEIPFLLEKLGGGLVVEENDQAGLAAAIDRLLADAGLRQELATRGRQMVRELFMERKIAVDFTSEISGLTLDPGAGLAGRPPVS